MSYVIFYYFFVLWGFGLWVFNATINNISDILWRSVLLVKETTDLPQVRLYYKMSYWEDITLCSNQTHNLQFSSSKVFFSIIWLSYFEWMYLMVMNTKLDICTLISNLYIFPLISTKDIFSINRLTMMGMILKIIWYRKLYDTENYMILKIIWYWKLWYWKLYDTENYHDTENYMILKNIWYWKLYDTENYRILKIIWYWKLSWYWKLYDTENYMILKNMILKIIWYWKLYDTENYMIQKIIWYWKLSWYWKLYDTENYMILKFIRAHPIRLDVILAMMSVLST